jgi:hypothetical protein
MNTKNHAYGALLSSALLMAACGSESSETPEPSAEDLELAMSALENPIRVCQEQALECGGKATDLAGAQACQETARKCLQGAGDSVVKLAESIAQCRDEQRACLRKEGLSGVESCSTAFRACVEGASPTTGDAGVPSVPQPDASAPTLPTLPDAGLPTWPTLPGDAGLPTWPTRPDDAGLPTRPGFPGGSDAGRPSFPGLPGGGDGGISLPGGGGFPGAGGGGLPGLPGRDCLDELRKCAAAPGASLIDCAGKARKCLAGGLGGPNP